MSRKRGEKRLRFGLVHERRYAIGLALNPAVSSGVSVGLSWDIVSERTLPLSESRRWSCRPQWLPPVVRREMLYRAGYTFQEVEAMRDSIVRTQKDRIKSLPPVCLLEQAPWFVARGVRRTLRRAFRKVPEQTHPLMTDDAPTVRLDRTDDDDDGRDDEGLDEHALVPANILRSTSACSQNQNEDDSDEDLELARKLHLIKMASSHRSDLVVDVPAVTTTRPQRTICA
mmetsp:Transcript_33237/g.106104  ORF Transcript_33237/g.106104 Transcript_33237/m.106104 type:complete len:228 (-) Transcript_33237:532-1215(-)